MCVFEVYACVCVSEDICVYSMHVEVNGSQKKATRFLELELQVFVSHHAGAGN